MQLPLFYEPDLPAQGSLTLSEESSKHIIGVLRMKQGEMMMLTNGQGFQATCEIVDDHRKRCVVKINSVTTHGERSHTAIAVSLVKNASRFEWFVEKATELGIGYIYPLICKRTESEKFRADRMQGIAVSAMLQSRQAFLPVVSEPVQFKDILNSKHSSRYIAHCMDDDKASLVLHQNDAVVLIGPEGDFTSDEVKSAVDAGFRPVSLGATRLRTETAALYAAVMLSK